MVVGQLIVFEVSANAFVLHMVRNMVGSLMEVGFGRQKPGWIADLIAGKDRCKSAATASPNGLYLVDVDYPQVLRFLSCLAGHLFLPGSL